MGVQLGKSMARASNSSLESAMSYLGAAPAVSDKSKANRTGREDNVRQGVRIFRLVEAHKSSGVWPIREQGTALARVLVRLPNNGKGHAGVNGTPNKTTCMEIKEGDPCPSIH